MSDQFLGEIRMFGGNFAPTGWALCNGQLMPIQQNTALFALLGTNYGGDGKTTFGLPNLQARIPMFWGQGPGLTDRVIGEVGGISSVTLTSGQLPAHGHQLMASSASGDQASPAGASLGSGGRGRPPLYTAQSSPVAMGGTTAPVGGSQPHNNRQPYLAVTFIIALTGIFPQHS